MPRNAKQPFYEYCHADLLAMVHGQRSACFELSSKVAASLDCHILETLSILPSSLLTEVVEFIDKVTSVYELTLLKCTVAKQQ
jgi:hypothetical protein